MDEGSTTPHNVASLLGYFDVSPNGFAWREPRPEQITERRAAMDDKLIFDILLISGGIRDPDFLYPPHDVAGLQRLLDAIDSSNYDILKKHTLIYSLLKWHQDGREEKFRVQFCIPPQFASLADAYWHLDTGINIAKAISILSDARLNRDYASKIIHAISLAPQPGPLLRKYVRTAKPPLVEPPDLLRYVVALAESSLFEAWQFQRTFSETDEMRPRLFTKILNWTIFPRPRPHGLKQLISLPLSSFEQALLNDYAAKPHEEIPYSAIALLQDLVCVRYVELGKYADAIKMDRKFATNGYDGKEASERRNMIQELYDSLPPVEKSLLDLEFNPIPKEKPQPVPKPQASVPTPARDVTMSQTWEDVHVPENLSKSTSTPLRNIQMPSTSAFASANTPRFTVPTAATPVSNSTAPPPILPISTTPLASTNAFTPRKSFPLSSANPLTSSVLTSGKGRPSLSGVGQRLAMGASPGVSSPASGMRFPLHAKSMPLSHATSTPSAQPKFVSTVRQANAFYQPKQQASQKGLFEEVATSPDRNATAESESGQMQLDDHEDVAQEEDTVPGWNNVGAEELTQSIFGGQPQTAPISADRTNTATAPPSRQNGKMKLPPGAFADEDDDMEEDTHEVKVPTPEPEPVAPRRRSVLPRKSRAKETVAPAPAKTTRRTRQVKQQDLGRSIPGSLMGEEDEDADEGEDQVAPLREPTPPPVISKRPVRKARSVASAASTASISDAGDEGEGMRTRRRSSRLTGTSSARNISPESGKGESVTARPRESGKATASRRKK